MKAINEVISILNNYTARFDCGCTVGEDFSFFNDDNLITVAFVLSDASATSFLNHVNHLYPNVKADIFLWSLFHEIGHCETVDEFDQEDWDSYYNAISVKISDEDYYDLPIEAAATDWAAHYLVSHSAEVAELWNQLAPAIKKVYIEGGLI